MDGAPIGTFYIGKMSSTDVINISKVSQRDSMGGHQRQLKNVRAKEIATYCTDPDATFPTPVILAVSEDDFIPVRSDNSDFVSFEYDETKVIAEILDGQHRIAGISAAADKEFELPVVVMFNLRDEQKAYVFSTINGNQVKVDRSLIYDLFDLSETPSPYKTCHYIARSMNSDPALLIEMLDPLLVLRLQLQSNRFDENLARFIKERFDAELKDLLLRYQWWNLAPEKLVEILTLLCDPDLEKLQRFLREQVTV